MKTKYKKRTVIICEIQFSLPTVSNNWKNNWVYLHMRHTQKLLKKTSSRELISYHCIKMLFISVDKSSECFRTTTTLCVPNLIFNHYTKHSYSLPPSIPVHTLLKRDGDPTQEIQFELWKRQYYPNIREQLIGQVKDCF